MSREDSTITMAAAAAEEEVKSVGKEFTMFHLDDGLIILEDGKRMPSEIYAKESIPESIKRLELENKYLENMLCSLETTIAKAAEALEAKREKQQELLSRQREDPIVVAIEAAVARKRQMELDELKHGQELTRLKLDELKHGQELTRLKAECDGSGEGGSKRKRIASKRGNEL